MDSDKLWIIISSFWFYRDHLKGNEALDDDWDDTAVDAFYKGQMPQWFSHDHLSNIKYYVVRFWTLQHGA